MADALPVAARQRDGIGAGEGRVAGVEQQLHRGAARRHQGVDVPGALPHGAHVVVVDEIDAARSDRLGHFRPPPAAAWPSVAQTGKPWWRDRVWTYGEGS